VTIVIGYTPTPAGRAALTTVGAELCVIGIRRRSAVDKMVLGSNAHRILMYSACPVLTVRAA
jgi:nucleotide-binding universal stress UspA family protein